MIDIFGFPASLDLPTSYQISNYKIGLFHQNHPRSSTSTLKTTSHTGYQRKMCIVHTVKYAGCEHIHSYAELVHADAAYCAHQQVLHDGTSTEQHKRPVCMKKDLKLAHVVGESWNQPRAQRRGELRRVERANRNLGKPDNVHRVTCHGSAGEPLHGTHCHS